MDSSQWSPGARASSPGPSPQASPAACLTRVGLPPGEPPDPGSSGPALMLTPDTSLFSEPCRWLCSDTCEVEATCQGGCQEDGALFSKKGINMPGLMLMNGRGRPSRPGHWRSRLGAGSGGGSGTSFPLHHCTVLRGAGACMCLSLGWVIRAAPGPPEIQESWEELIG